MGSGAMRQYGDNIPGIADTLPPRGGMHPLPFPDCARYNKQTEYVSFGFH